MKALKEQLLPKPSQLRAMFGPSLILLGLGLGSGEIILWPYLASNFGLGILWAALVGIAFQFFLNMEVERYTLTNGESVFVGFARLKPALPVWFIVSTFIGFGLPGIVAVSAKILAGLVGLTDFRGFGIGLLLLIGAILSLGPSLYRTLETYQKIVISIAIPIILLLTLFLVDGHDWRMALAGLVGQGQGYRFLPEGLPIFTFLGALAYAGAGGNLNLAQSFYVKDKGYGMGRFSGQIKSVITGQAEEIDVTGTTFKPTPQHLRYWRGWWVNINLEHGLVFFGLGLLTIILLAVLAYATTHGQVGNAQDVNFLFLESAAIGQALGSVVGQLFLLLVALLLFGTQLTIMDAVSRIITENVALLWKKPLKLAPLYYTVLWLILGFGIVIFLAGSQQPRSLVELGAAFNAIAMFAAFALVPWLNYRLLPAATRPSLWRLIILGIAFLFFGYFSSQVLATKFG